MSAGALSFVTYLWHYLVARLLYDQVVRPLVHGRVSALLTICAVGGGAFLIGWASGRLRRGPASRRRA
jgi:peptidoglycan/LPS O-acetylase OafA/YrhL